MKNPQTIDRNPLSRAREILYTGTAANFNSYLIERLPSRRYRILHAYVGHGRLRAIGRPTLLTFASARNAKEYIRFHYA